MQAGAQYQDEIHQLRRFQGSLRFETFGGLLKTKVVLQTPWLPHRVYIPKPVAHTMFKCTLQPCSCVCGLTCVVFHTYIPTNDKNIYYSVKSYSSLVNMPLHTLKQSAAVWRYHSAPTPMYKSALFPFHSIVPLVRLCAMQVSVLIVQNACTDRMRGTAACARFFPIPPETGPCFKVSGPLLTFMLDPPASL
jgi:hypothetical protein